MTRRRWIANEWSGDSAILRDAQAAHLARVLRAHAGQEFEIVVGDAIRRGIVSHVTANAVEFSLHERIQAPNALPLTIALAVIRFERMEWAIEKLTELAVARIVPLRADRSDRYLCRAAEKRVERWRRIAFESAQQSRRDDVPEISVPVALREFLAGVADTPRLVLSEHERGVSLRNWLESTNNPASLANLHAAIGPEGGWTERELTQFAARGWQSITLGPRILRAETAAIMLASVVGMWLRP